jgi:hypothetical protein
MHRLGKISLTKKERYRHMQSSLNYKSRAKLVGYKSNFFNEYGLTTDLT